MSGWTVQIDPSAVATGRTMLDLNAGARRVDQKGIDWGQAAITAYMAQQSKYGSAPADFIVPNRTVTIPLFLGTGDYATEADQIAAEEAAREQLQQKVGLLQREGGWLLRQRAGGSAMYADIVNATLTLPDVWGETGGVEPDVVLVLECLPDFYGDEIVLDSASATGVYTGVLQDGGVDAVIEGDYPARARIIVTDTSGNDQNALLWGVRSRHYDSSTEAALFYEAESMTPVNGATVTALSGASGGNVVKLASLPSGSWATVLTTDDAPLVHTGSYRAWVRAYSASATPQLRLIWGVGSLSVPVTNDPVTLPGSGAFYLLDLGVVRLDAPPVGSNQWLGAIQALAANTGDPVSIDCVYFQPLDDGAGELTYVSVAPASSIQAGPNSPAAAANDAAAGTVAWTAAGGASSLISAIDTPDDFAAGLAAATAGAGVTTEWLKATNYGFSVPAGVTIQGIQASVYYGSDSPATYTVSARLAKAGTVQSGTPGSSSTSAYHPLDPDGHVTTFGGPTDLWGGAWTSTDINNSGFGLAFAFTGGSGAQELDVDYISVTVYYTLASGFTVAQDAVVYANGICEARYDGMYRQGPTSGPYGPVSQHVGDLVRLPPSGIEDRAVQLFVKPSRGDTNTLPDAGLDGFTVQVKYRPCWLGRP